ncbi:HAD family phosphatase [Tessaracoccus sp. HDW20]|uniref:HAD family hydrolase n=1 Tax=Tessaracoccus coleopterorum TaxID=2714950 RepID=UPI0018D3EABF|nr:HAD family phosphatase [Tessaracoccus coleopterorum]NHB85292.1 HAD family phosphatase [Tessaracoccus coleopterorum]
MIHAVVFDLGEVLASPPSLLPDLARRLGVEEEALSMRYWDGRVGYDAGCPAIDYWGPILEDLGVEPTDALVEEIAGLDAAGWTELRSTARQLLRDVRGSGVSVAVLTNSPHAMQKAADAAAWRREVNHLFVSATVGMTKPDPDLYRHVAARLGLDPQQIAYIDDNPANVAAAVELGWRGHVFTTDAATRVWLVGLGVL